MGRRNAVQDALAKEREERRAERQARGPAKLATMPRCTGCGTSVPDRETKFCDVCAAKPSYQAPQGTINTAPQQVPAYQREPNA